MGMENIEGFKEVGRDIINDIFSANEPEMWPVRSNWPSMLGHECLRFLVHMRLDWRNQAPFGKTFRLLLKGGEYYEKFAIHELELAGYKCEQQNRPLDLYEEHVTGKIDLVIVLPTERAEKLEKLLGYKWDGYPRVVGEVKGLNPQDWFASGCADDMLNSSKQWVRKYPAQLLVYQKASKIHMGAWILVNKMTWEIKPVFYPYDEEYMSYISDRCKQVNKHVSENTYPDRIPFCETCIDCSFKAACDPPQLRGEAIKLYTDDNMFALLSRMEELYKAHAEYQRLDEKRKKMWPQGENVIIPGKGGQFAVTWKQIQRKGYVVEPSCYWKPTVRYMPMDQKDFAPREEVDSSDE